MHETDNIKINFNANKDYFTECKHYFKLTGETLKFFKDRIRETYLVGKNANVRYLCTKRGVLRHYKMLGTDKTWEMFDLLEENYFYDKRRRL